MKRLFQRLFKKPVLWLANKLASSPSKPEIETSLNSLLRDIRKPKPDQGPIVPFDLGKGRFIIVSDQHKGGKDLADDFHLAEDNYMHALEYYYQNGYTLINLGDCEELWECSPSSTIEKNRITLLEEAKFLQSDRYYRIFGNHDLEWKFLVPQTLHLRPIFGEKLKVYEGLVLETVYNDHTYTIFLTHGHQGDKRSHGNAFSEWVVAAIWTPIQRFLDIRLDTISDYFELVDRHNIMMYEWSATQKRLIFISGHTHKPVFASMDHIDRLGKELERATENGDTRRIAWLQTELQRRKKEYEGKKIVQTMLIPSYFNTGCCCFSDGDITGIEICDGDIKLVKWEKDQPDAIPARKILEQASLGYIFDNLTGDTVA